MPSLREQIHLQRGQVRVGADGYPEDSVGKTLPNLRVAGDR